MGFLDNLLSSIIDPNKSGGFASGSAKAQTSGGSKTAPSASKGSAKATSYATTGKSSNNGRTANSTARKNYLDTGNVSGKKSDGGAGDGGKNTAAQQALEDYAVQSAVDRARSIVDEEAGKGYGFEALNAEVKAAQDKAKNAELNFAATLEKYNYDAGNPNVKSAQAMLDDALREAKIYTAAAEKGSQIKDRRENFGIGNLKQYAGSMLDAAGTAYEGGARGAQAQTEREIAELEQRMARAEEAYNKNASESNAAYLADVQRELSVLKGIDYSKLDEVTDKIYGKADELTTEGAEAIEKAKEGLGKGGQFAVDAASAGAQLLGDLAVGAATGGIASIPMALRSFGGAAGEARREGATYEEQVGYGAANAALEFATEKLFGGDAGVYGKGLFDSLPQKVLSKLQSSPAGKAALRVLGQMGQEGLEEAIASVGSTLLQGIYNDKSLGENWDEVKFTDVLYDGLIGAALGGAGAVVSTNTKPTTGEEAMVRDIRNAAEANISALEKADLQGEYSVERAEDGTTTIRIHNAMLSDVPRDKWVEAVRNKIQTIFEGGITLPRGTVFTNKKGRGEFTNGSYTKMLEREFPDLYEAKMNMAPGTGAMVENAENVKPEDPAHPRRDDIVKFNRGNIRVVIEDAGYTGDVLTAIYSDGREIFFDVNNIAKSETGATPERYAATRSGFSQTDATPASKEIPLKDIVPPPAPVVNTQSEEISQASESAANAASDTGSEITPSATESAEIGAPVEFNVATAQTTMGKGPERERGMSEGVRTNEANEAELRQSFEDAPEMYTQLTNAEVQAKADAILAKGLDAAEKEVTEAIGQAKKGYKLAPEYAVAAQSIANELVRTKDEANIAKARELMSDVMAEFTAAGQFAQIGRLLRQSDPATKTMTIQKLVEKLNADLNQRQMAKNVKRGLGDEKGKIVVSDELLNRFATAENDATRDAVMNEIEQAIADQIPATFRDKFTALRYLNMLGNFKTQGRNITGNTLAALATATKRRVQAVTELGAALATGGKYERNTSLFVSPELRKQATADFANVEASIMGEAKYSDVGRQLAKGIQDKQRVFDNKVLEGYRKATNWAMEMGDAIFLKFHYADALAGYLQARGISNVSEASPELLNNARTFAIKEAQEATFRDDNAVSNFVTKIGRGKDTPKVAKAISEGIMPFRKTPANVAVRAVEYSPVGLLKSATVDAYRASQGDISPADVINNVAKGATGTALAVAGYLLAQAGLAKGSEEDDELAAFQKNQGEMDYSIKIGDTYVSLSQFAPMAVPFFMGVKLQEILEAQEGAFSLDTTTALLGAITDPMLEMSMLSGVNDAFSNLSSVSGDADALPQLAANSMISYLSQGLTNSLLGQFEQASEENRQTTYTANETAFDDFVGKGQYKLGQIAAKTPGVDYHQQDYVDAWGRTQSNGDAMTRAFNAFLNPTYTSQARSTEVDAELERLYRDNKDVEGFDSVFPEKRGRSDVYGDGKVMTPDEYLQFSKDSGQMKLELVSDFIGSEQYANLDDKQRAEVISNLYQFADDRALKKVKEANSVNAKSDWDDEAELPNLPAYLTAKTVYSDATDAKNEAPNYAAVDAVLSGLGSMDKATRDKLDEQSGFKNLRFAYEVFGMDAEKALSIDKLLDAEQGANLKGSNSGAADAVVIAKNYKGSDDEKLKALEVANLPYADTGKRRSVVRRTEAAMGQGISFDDWASIEAYVDKTKTSDTPNKSTIVAAGKALGYDGNLVYQIYKKFPNDEDLVTQTNDYFNKDYVAPEDVDLFEYITGMKLPDTAEADKASSGGGGRGGYGGRYRGGSSKPANLGNSVSAVRSIANSGGTSNTNKYMRQALNDVLAQNKKQQAAQPTVRWEDLLAGYVKGIK